MNFYAQSIEDVLKKLETSAEGLTKQAADKRLIEYGKNLLPSNDAKTSRLKIFLSQWKSPLVIILFVAGTVSGVVGEFADMTIIFVTVLVNTMVGFLQEDKANRALQKLSSMVDHMATVMRDGKIQGIASSELVPGDIIQIEAGDSVPADGRILRAIECEVNEAPLTGESLPVRKKADVIADDLSLGDRINMVYRGTAIINGKATVVVTAIGARTELGAIATLVKDTPDEQTPLQKQLSVLARQLGIIVVVIVCGIILLGLIGIGEKYTILELFQTAVAVAVAAIPEGLAISLTIILAIGMQFILKRQGLVRRMLAAETLGSVSVICTDKTGTLTLGVMQVTQVVTATETLTQTDLAAMDKTEHAIHRDIRLALRIGVLANNAIIEYNTETKTVGKTRGDTTEIALAAAAMKAGMIKYHLDAEVPRLDEIPFTSERKFMATLHMVEQTHIIYVKGAPEIMLPRCTLYEKDGEEKPLSAEQMNWFTQAEKRLAIQGLRLLIVAYKPVQPGQETINESDIQDLVCVGLIGLSDPVRDDVPSTIARCQSAGIRVIMLTGDHRDTAVGIGQSIGLGVTEANVIDASVLTAMSDADLETRVATATVFSRMNPSDKIRIVKALQKLGEVVAVTGDGVNDAPALKGANIGVAIGSGSDVAKETADLVLLNDSFTTIVAAVEEGRRIYHNIKKVILYLLAGSFSEIILIVGSMLAKLPLAILPAQILWVNIIQETFPTMALAFDAGEKENMLERPRPGHRQLLDRDMKWIIAVMSIIPNFLLLGLFFYLFNTTNNLALSRTVMFAGLTLASIAYIYAIRSKRYHLWQKNPFDNWHLNAATLFGLALFLGALYVPTLQTLLHTVPLQWHYWLMLFGFGAVNVIIIEVMKKILNEFHERADAPPMCKY